MQSHFHASDVDGGLYDTREPGWHTRPPLRRVFCKVHVTINTPAEFKATLRAGAYAWPGGYPLYFITSDGAALSFAAGRKELRQILDSIRHNHRDGWRVVGCGINWEDSELVCDHTGERIESAY